jgi:hypothetical protein
MKAEHPNWTRRGFLTRLTLSLGATATVGCGPEGAGSVQLRNSGGKSKTLTERGAGKTRRRVPGPNDMKPL